MCRPGASSLLGLLLENGPIHVTLTNNIVPNNSSWDKFMDYFWIDVRLTICLALPRPYNDITSILATSVRDISLLRVLLLEILTVKILQRQRVLDF